MSKIISYLDNLKNDPNWKPMVKEAKKIMGI